LAEQAAALGVRRLVFLSSIGVLGIHTNGRGPFFVSDAPAPVEDYAISKWEAEQALWAVSARTGLEVVVVRLPLVYGPGAKGNLLRLASLVARGLPLPLGALRNQRSLVGLSNLVDLLRLCAAHPAAAGQTLLVSDGQDLSTPQLIRLLAEGMNKPAHLLPMPEGVLRAAGSLFGKRAEVDRLVESLQVDSRYTAELLGWTPPVSVEDGVREMGRWYASLQSVRAR
jgi:nucleoside-diphosphate-sugar epimerase